jgi:ribosome-associated protein
MQPIIRQYYNLEELWGEKAVRLKFGAAKPLVKAESAPKKEEAAKPAGSLKRSNAAKKGVQEAFPSKAQVKKNLVAAQGVAKRSSSNAAAKPLAKTAAPKPVAKTVVVNAPAKKLPAKKAPAQKAAAKKAPAKRAPVRQAAAKTAVKPVARKTATRKA